MFGFRVNCKELVFQLGMVIYLLDVVKYVLDRILVYWLFFIKNGSL